MEHLRQAHYVRECLQYVYVVGVGFVDGSFLQVARLLFRLIIERSGV